MRKYKRERAVTEIKGDAGSVTGGALNEASLARRSFLGQIGRWSAALAVVGLGPEAWMQAVSRRSIMATAVAAGASGNFARDPQLHPFPSDDPFNMPLGVDAWYAPIDDPATSQFVNRSMAITVNNGWSHPIFFPNPAVDPMHTFTHRRWGDCPWRSCQAESYREEENLECCIYEYLQSGADTKSNIEGLSGYWDDHLHVIIGNELVELFQFGRTGTNTANVGRLVRNQLDHYSFSRYKFSNPLANTAGTRAYGGVGIAGLIRKHEVETQNPHIPHAFAIAQHRRGQAGIAGDGDSESPLFNVTTMFPANNYDSGGYARHYSKCYDQNGDFISGCRSEGNFRMGMRFALDPAIATDAWIEANAPILLTSVMGVPAGTPNPWAIAFARAMRDYGCLVTDTSLSSNIFYGEEGIATDVENALRNGLNFIRPAVRRVAGAGPLHSPLESHWETWRANGQGWGGGAPRVPYLPPLASGAIPPQSPGNINVSESRKFGDTA